MEETEAAAKSLAEQGLKRVTAEAQAAAAALDAQQAALTRLQREQDEIANAKMAVELAEADASSDPESVKLKKKAEIRKKYAEDAFKLAQQIDRARLAENREAIDRQLKNSDAGHAKQAALEEDLAKAKANDAEEGSLAGKLPNVQRWREQQEKRLAEAQAAMDAARAKPGILTPAKLIYYKGERDDAETQANAARAEEKRLHQRILQTRAGRGVGSTADIQAELDRTKKENEKRDEQLRQDEAQKQRENAEIESRMRVREATQPDKQKAVDITTNAEVAKARAAEEKAREEKAARDADAAREEAARAAENKLREMELARAAPADLVAQRGRVAKARLPADATPEQRRAAELAGQERSSDADKNDFFRRANNTATQLSTAEQIQKQDIRQIGVQGGETVAGAIKKAMEQMGVTLADTLSADDLARAIKGSTDSIAKSYSDLLTRLKDVEDRLRKGK
ncbi:MAG: hypothetical protein IT578_05050 [Verrucomicrobiae bacterium]|nr:hypothetical protein [Verrucomicrobiae bacterium]